MKIEKQDFLKNQQESKGFKTVSPVIIDDECNFKCTRDFFNNIKLRMMDITQETDEQITNSSRGKLNDIFWMEDNEPSVEEKSIHKQWEKDLLQKYKEYNTFVGRKAFNETKIKGEYDEPNTI